MPRTKRAPRQPGVRPSSAHPAKPSIRLYLAVYLLWILLAAVGLLTTLQVRLALLDIVLLYINAWAVKAVDNFLSLGLILLWLVTVVFIEAYLRHGVPHGQLWRRAWRIGLFEVVLLTLAFAVQALTTLQF